MSENVYLKVWLDVPLQGPFDYLAPAMPPGGQNPSRIGGLVQVPWGTRQLVGIVVAQANDARACETPANKLRTITQVLHAGLVFPEWWLAFAEFAASYYHRTPGELVLPSLPKSLRAPHTAKTREATRLLWNQVSEQQAKKSSGKGEPWPELRPAQAALLAKHAIALANPEKPLLLHGVTGSGKTEIYLHLIRQCLAAKDVTQSGQTLFLLPEIALTPQFLALIQARFPSETVVGLHSGMTDTARTKAWAQTVTGQASIVVGTRLAVLTPFRRIKLIIVDEEHDPSYKQSEGVHYSARDLAIALAARCQAAVVLGSATPAMESWRASAQGRYTRASLAERAHQQPMPSVQTLNVRGVKLRAGLHPVSIEQIRGRLAKSEQCLLFLNRRGFSPVLHCSACTWTSQCDNCSCYRVLHRLGTKYRLACHHCGHQAAVPRACPQCGNLDLTPMGKGTQRLELELQELFPAARIGRLDRDVANKTGAADAVIAAMHEGSLDILVGTQMLAKGHNFEKLSLVVVVDADNGLFASDFRAPERLFSNLMQVAGRAGRTGLKSDVLVQTATPDHPLFAALKTNDYLGFAQQQLSERQQALLPPFTHQALFRAQAKTLEQTMQWLEQASTLAKELATREGVTLYDPVPMPLMRKAGMERAQLLIESASRPALHRFLKPWLTSLREQKTAVQWQLDIDPQEI